jgi:hypothetical protein
MEAAYCRSPARRVDQVEVDLGKLLPVSRTLVSAGSDIIAVGFHNKVEPQFLNLE